MTLMIRRAKGVGARSLKFPKREIGDDGCGYILSAPVGRKGHCSRVIIDMLTSGVLDVVWTTGGMTEGGDSDRRQRGRQMRGSQALGVMPIPTLWKRYKRGIADGKD